MQRNDTHVRRAASETHAGGRMTWEPGTRTVEAASSGLDRTRSSVRVLNCGGQVGGAERHTAAAQQRRSGQGCGEGQALGRSVDCGAGGVGAAAISKQQSLHGDSTNESTRTSSSARAGAACCALLLRARMQQPQQGRRQRQRRSPALPAASNASSPCWRPWTTCLPQPQRRPCSWRALPQPRLQDRG